MELVRSWETGEVGLVERSPVIEELERGFEGVRPWGRRGRMEVVVTLALVTVGQHVDCSQLL